MILTWLGLQLCFNLVLLCCLICMFFPFSFRVHVRGSCSSLCPYTSSFIIHFVNAFVFAWLNKWFDLMLCHCLHCTRWGGWQQNNARMPWWVFRSSMSSTSSRMGLLRATRDRRTDHRHCRLTYECHPLRQQRSVAWRKMHTCRWCSDWLSKCSSPEQKNNNEA